MKSTTGVLATAAALCKSAHVHPFTLLTLQSTVANNRPVAQRTSATTTPYCPTNNVCFRWGIPEAAVSSGSGDVFFQIMAPTSYQWVAVGIGSGMSGSQMFVIYQDGNGNVTLSPRAGTGHVEPKYSANSGVDLIDGSGVSGSEMTANIRCSDCSSLDLSGSNSWIAAWKKGSALDSTSMTQSISEHDGTDSFDLDFSAASASFSTSGNPFTSSNSTSGDSSSSNNGGISSGGGSSDTVSYAHGVVMAIVFVIAYPVGAVLMPLVGNWIIHASWQTLAFLGMWAGFGIGYVVAHDDGSVSLPCVYIFEYAG